MSSSSSSSSSSSGEIVKVNTPTLRSPNGGEVIDDRNVTISWQESIPKTARSEPVWYEIFFTDSYRPDRTPEWRMIASIPSGTTSFSWRRPMVLQSSNCRFAIRSRNYQGQFGGISISAANVTLEGLTLRTPALISPVENGTYNNYVPFVFDHSLIDKTPRQRAYYEIYYSRSNTQSGWTLVRGNLTVGSEPFYWDVSTFAAADDYTLKVVMLDDDGNSSVPLILRNISISPHNNVIIDTLPPKGTVRILNERENKQYLNERNLVLQLNSWDASTGVQKLTVKEADGTGAVINDGVEEDVANIKTFRISEGDGVKVVQAEFRDFGSNVISVSTGSLNFRPYFADTDEGVVAFLLDGSRLGKSGDGTEPDDVWVSVNGDLSTLYLDGSQVATHDGEATSMSKLGVAVYIGTRNDDNTGTLHKYEEATFSTANEFTGTDSAILSMATYGAKTYIGLQNGELYSFDGSVLTLVNTFDSSVVGLDADGSHLYVMLDVTYSLQLYDGTTFTSASVINGDQ